jgi:uncharacterized phiE125 gp8 family phage protein
MSYGEYGWNAMLGGRVISDSYVKLVADVSDEPLTLDDSVIHSRIDLGSPADSDEQAYVESLFPAARKAIEKIINKPIGEQKFELGMTWWGCGFLIEIPKVPLIAIKTITYKKLDGTVVTWYDATASPAVDPDKFIVETGSEPGAIFLKVGESWPLDALQGGFPVKIQFTAGITDIPEDILQAMRFAFGHFYDNREPVTDGRVNQPFEVPKTMDWLGEKYEYRPHI